MNDFIRKTSILDKISASISLPSDNEFDCGYNTAMAEIREWVRNQNDKPTKKGYWKPIMMSEATGWDLSLTGGYDEVCEYVCSQCNECANVDEFGECILSKYCPNCGARMDGGAENVEKNCENCARETCAVMPPIGKCHCDFWQVMPEPPESEVN